MGQPTHSLTQHVGKTQFWQFMPAFGACELAYADAQFKLTLAAKLAPIFCLCLPILGLHHPWSLPRLTVVTMRTRAERRRLWAQRPLPDLASLRGAEGAVIAYFETRAAVPISLDPDALLSLIPYTRRVNPMQGLF